MQSPLHFDRTAHLATPPLCCLCSRTDNVEATHYGRHRENPYRDLTLCDDHAKIETIGASWPMKAPTPVRPWQHAPGDIVPIEPVTLPSRMVTHQPRHARIVATDVELIPNSLTYGYLAEVVAMVDNRLCAIGVLLPVNDVIHVGSRLNTDHRCDGLTLLAHAEHPATIGQRVVEPPPEPTVAAPGFTPAVLRMTSAPLEETVVVELSGDLQTSPTELLNYAAAVAAAESIPAPAPPPPGGFPETFTDGGIPSDAVPDVAAVHGKNFAPIPGESHLEHINRLRRAYGLPRVLLSDASRLVVDDTDIVDTTKVLAPYKKLPLGPEDFAPPRDGKTYLLPGPVAPKRSPTWQERNDVEKAVRDVLVAEFAGYSGTNLPPAEVAKAAFAKANDKATSMGWPLARIGLYLDGPSPSPTVPWFFTVAGQAPWSAHLRSIIHTEPPVAIDPVAVVTDNSPDCPRDPPCATKGFHAADECTPHARTPLPDIDLTTISPGVRDLVASFRKAGIRTTDSGDGSNHAAGMECALPYPHVFAVTDVYNVSRDVQAALKLTPADWHTEVQYDSRDGVWAIMCVCLPDVQAPAEPSPESAGRPTHAEAVQAFDAKLTQMTRDTMRHMHPAAVEAATQPADNPPRRETFTSFFLGDALEPASPAPWAVSGNAAGFPEGARVAEHTPASQTVAGHPLVFPQHQQSEMGQFIAKLDAAIGDAYPGMVGCRAPELLLEVVQELAEEARLRRLVRMDASVIKRT